MSPHTHPNSPIVFDRLLDLTGRQCPMTFVYTKVTLEQLEPGQILKVVLDFRSAFTNVPKSVTQQNLGEILEKIETDGLCELFIKRI